MPDLDDLDLEQLEIMLDNAGVANVLKAVEMYCMSMMSRDQQQNHQMWMQSADDIRRARWDIKDRMS